MRINKNNKSISEYYLKSPTRGVILGLLQLAQVEISIRYITKIPQEKNNASVLTIFFL